MKSLLHAKIRRASENQLQTCCCQRQAMPRAGESRFTDGPAFPSYTGRPAPEIVIYRIRDSHADFMNVLTRPSCCGQRVGFQRRRATLQLFHNTGNRLQSVGGRIKAEPVAHRVHGVRMINPCVYPLDRIERTHHEWKMQYSSSKVGNLLVLKSLPYTAFAVRLPESSRRQDCGDGENRLRPCRSDLARRPTRGIRYNCKDHTAYDCHAQRERALEIEPVHVRIPCSAPLRMLTPGEAAIKPLQLSEADISMPSSFHALPDMDQAA